MQAETLSTQLQQQEERGQVSLTKCLIHRRTAILGRPRKDSKLCECCGMMYQKRQLDILFLPADTFYLGPGLSSYFLFIKSCIFLSLFCALVFSLPNIVTNLISRDCLNSDNLVKCVSTRYIDLSVANKLGQQNYLQIQSYLAAITILGMILGLQYSRKKAMQLQAEAEATLNESDFAVMIRLRVGDYNQEDIRQGIKEWWDREKSKPILNRGMGSEFPVQKVILSYKISDYEALKEQRKQIKQFQNKSQKSKAFRSSKVKGELEEKNKRLAEVQQQLLTKDLPKNNKCVVVFKYPEQQQYVVQKHEKTLLRMMFSCCYNFISIKGKVVTIRAAALPSEINWHNHEVQTRKKHLWRLFIKFLCVLIIAAAEGGVFGLLYLTFKKNPTGIQQFDEYISPLLSVLIAVINIVLYRALTWVSKYEYRATSLEDRVSITWKIIISIFLNSGVMLLFAYFILDLNSVWVANGFIDTMTFSYLLVTVLPHVFSYIINIDFYVMLIRRAKVKCFPKSFTQSEANAIHERPVVELYEKYAWMINLMWWSSVFAPIIPVSYPCAFVSLFVHFWSEKFQYVALIREPKPFGSYLNTSLLKVLEAAPLFLAVGNIGLNLALIHIKKESIVISVLLVDLVSIGVALAVFLVPTKVIIRCTEWIFCIKQALKEGLSYQVAEKSFITTYERENPIYRSDAIKDLRGKQANAKRLGQYQSQPQFQQIEMQNLVDLSEIESDV